MDALDHELLFLDDKYRMHISIMFADILVLQESKDSLSRFITSHVEFPNFANRVNEFLDPFKPDEREKVSISLFKLLKTCEDEKFIKAIFVYLKEQYSTFAHNEQQLTVEQIRSNKLMTLEKSSREKIATDAKVFVSDLIHYKTVERNISLKWKEIVSIEWQEISVARVREHFQKAILSSIAWNIREQRTAQSGTAEGIGDSLYDFIDSLEPGSVEGISPQKTSIQAVKSNPEIAALAEKYAFFKLVQNSASKGYVLTKSELTLISDILRDLSSGKVVLLTGDTGSGKTELARFLCREYLKKEPVFIKSSKDMDVADLTMQQVITSRSPLSSTSRDSIIVEEETDRVKALEKKAHSLISLLNHKKELQKIAEDYSDSDDSKKEIAEFFNTFELGKSSLVTEYHLMAIYKAAELGLPAIIDEVNLIRPEIFMALNDILTRRIGDAIQLPNALGSIIVKPGFCIIMTGNDPDQNSKKKRYTQGRYAFDEASYNRLRVYAKGYATQKEKLFTENKIVSSDWDMTEEYLADNELYGMLIQMMLQKDGDLMKAGKYGFEIMKRDLDGKSLDRDQLFASLKNLAHSISTIQNAYAGNRETLTNPQFKTLSLSTSIKRKVFSMRNLMDVYESYKTDVRPLEYHLYREFIKLTTNREEQYALLAIFHEYGFFADLITDDINKSLQNAQILFQKLEAMKYSLSDIESKILITKQDIYKEYFGSFDFPDSVFHGMDLQDPEPEIEAASGDILGTNNEITVDDMATYCEVLNTNIDKHFDIFSSDELSLLNSIVTAVHSSFVDAFDLQEPKRRAHIGELLKTMINVLVDDTVSESGKAVFMDLMRSIGVK